MKHIYFIVHKKRGKKRKKFGPKKALAYEIPSDNVSIRKGDKITFSLSTDQVFKVVSVEHLITLTEKKEENLIAQTLLEVK